MQRHGFSINRGAHDARRVAVAVPMCKLLHGELIVFNCSLLADESLRLAKAREAGYALRDMVRHIEVAIGMRTLDNERALSDHHLRQITPACFKCPRSSAVRPS